MGRAERRVDRSELRLIHELKEHPLTRNASENEELLRQLEVVEAKLVKAASFYLGDLRYELNQIERYIDLEERYQYNSPAFRAIGHKLSALIQNTQQEIAELLHWIQSTESILRQIKSAAGKSAEDELENHSRRSFLRRVGMAAAGVALGTYGKPAKAFSPNQDHFSSEQKFNAILAACTFLEEFFENQMHKLGERVLLTPHADYTHFNRVGEWKHSMIKGSQGIADVGAHREGIFEVQRMNATAARQPTDKEVSILERSFITLVNMKGRSKVAAAESRLLVPKHFPGGTPEMELTEAVPVILEKGYNHQAHLLPFRYLLKQGLTKAIMISHAAYPRLEEDYKQKYYEKYEVPVIQELVPLGWTAAHHAAWTKIRPATTSPTLVRGLLREELGFRGLVYADAVIMNGLEDRVFSLCILINALQKMIGDPELSHEIHVNKGVLVPILLIYAGVDILTMLRQADYPAVAKFAASRPYFLKYLQEAYNRVKHQHEQFGWKLSKDPFDHGAEQFAHPVLDNTLINSWSDPWDRGGSIHQIFRRKYLAILYHDPSIFDDQERFWRLHQNINWAALDPLYQQIIETKYL